MLRYVFIIYFTVFVSMLGSAVALFHDASVFKDFRTYHNVFYTSLHFYQEYANVSFPLVLLIIAIWKLISLCAFWAAFFWWLMTFDIFLMLYLATFEVSFGKCLWRSVTHVSISLLSWLFYIVTLCSNNSGTVAQWQFIISQNFFQGWL